MTSDSRKSFLQICGLDHRLTLNHRALYSAFQIQHSATVALRTAVVFLAAAIASTSSTSAQLPTAASLVADIKELDLRRSHDDLLRSHGELSLRHDDLSHKYQDLRSQLDRIEAVGVGAPWESVLSGTTMDAQDTLDVNTTPACKGVGAGCGCHNCTKRKNRIPLHPYWENGLRIISDDESFNLHIGGDLQWDSVWLNGSESVLGVPSSNASSTTNSGASLLRRARVKVEGKMIEQFDYSLEYDLSNSANDNNQLQPSSQANVSGSPIPRNVWVQRRDVPFFGRIRIGNQVKPIGMERNTSHLFLPFMERSDNMDAFYGPFEGGYEPGISANNWTQSERITWRYGIFRPLKNSYGIAINKYTVSGRVTALTVFEEGGAQLLHIGLSGAQGNLDNDEFRLRNRPLLRNGPGYAIPVVADTGELPGSSQILLGPELAGVLGPWTFQTEWTGQFFTSAFDANGQSQGTVFFQGGYFQALYFLTGEHQRYDKERGSFGRVIPNNSVRRGSVSGGAWQIGARFSYVDLTDKAIDGGQIADMTIGLNWFLNPNLKIQGNYLLANRQGQQGQGDGWFNGLGIRAACDF